MAPRQICLRHLADTVQDRLPRELRDNIYQYLWSDAVEAGWVYDMDTPQCSFDEKQHPHFTMKDVVGNSFAHEAVTWIYENFQGFEVTAAQTNDFLRHDVFEVGLSPSCSKLRRLKVRCMLPSARFINQFPLVDYLMPLTQIELRPYFQLEIDLSSRPESGQKVFIYPLAKVAQDLQPLVAALKASQNVSVMVNFNHALFGKFDIKNRLKPMVKAEWFSFVDRELRQAVDRRFRQDGSRGFVTKVWVRIITELTKDIWEMDDARANS